MKVACMLVTHLRAKVEIRRQPHLKDSPVLIVDRNPLGARPVVVDHFRSASRVTAGMTMERALSHNTNAVVLDADEPHYRRVFGQMLTALQRISDRVEGAELGTAYVRLDGLEGMYRGEAGAVSALLNAVPAYLNPRIGVAGAKFPAFVAARTCSAHGAFRVPGDVEAFLAPHSIDLLTVSADVKSEMHRFGLHTMGAVASMSEHMLADQFGPDGGRAWALCNGRDDSPVVPLEFEESVVEHTSLPFHSSSIEALLVAVDALLRRAYARPDMKARYAGAADLLCAASGWPPCEKSVRFKQPHRRVGEGLHNRPKPVGGGPSPQPDRGRDAHPLQLHGRVRYSDGAVGGRSGRQAPEARGGGQEVAGADGRRPLPPQNRRGSPLAPRA